MGEMSVMMFNVYKFFVGIRETNYNGVFLHTENSTSQKVYNTCLKESPYNAWCFRVEI